MLQMKQNKEHKQCQENIIGRLTEILISLSLSSDREKIEVGS